jgi:hypothetical protein
MTDVTRSGLPTSAAWRHSGARDGFESVFLFSDGSGCRLAGHAAALEDGTAWAVHYAISLDSNWLTSTARIEGWSTSGHREVVIEGDGVGGWRIDGRAAPELDGCLDVDLESSACTNAFPVNRLHLGIGQAADAPAAYVRALDLSVGRLEQRYVRVDDDGTTMQYDYLAPAFDFEARLTYDEAGLVLDYPGIARRVL